MQHTSDKFTDKLLEEILVDACGDDEQLWAFHQVIGAEVPLQAATVFEGTNADLTFRRLVQYVRCTASCKVVNRTMTMPPHTPTVLVVDDDPEELASACKTLGARYTVLAATSGEDALRMARAARPGAIVLDVMMAGGKDGFTTFREIQRDPATRDIPVVFLTNVGKTTGLPFGSSELDRYLGREPAAFLEKPVSADTLVGIVAKSLDERKDGPAEGGAVCKQS